MRRRLSMMLAATGLLFGGALADAQVSGEDTVLHEYFNPWDIQTSGPASAASGEGGEGGQSAQPPGERSPVVAGEPPDLSVNPGSEEVIFGAQGPVDPGATAEPYGPLEPGRQSSPLDAATDRVDQLNYYASFEPSVIPYKRTVVQNAVRYDSGDYAVELRSRRRISVPIEAGAAADGEEIFWGSFLLRAEPDQPHPLPSVAPSQRILEVQAEPDVDLRFEKDEADNVYVRPQYDGLVRLNVKIAVAQSYFSGAFSEQVRWSQFPADLTPELPASVETVTASVLATLGVSRQMPPRAALLALVEHYRDFEGRALPDELRGSDLYASLSREQLGVCRHRSLAFLISARAVGIPTRYVYNEAHAFVEVYWPQMGWRRIDLGGAADELNHSSRAGGSVHDAGADELPQPPNYAAELERLEEQEDASAGDDPASDGEADVQMSDGQMSEEQTSPSDGQTEGGAQQDGEGQADMDLPGEEFSTVDPSQMHTQPEPLDHEQLDAQDDPRSRVIIDVQADAQAVFRGNALGLRGSVFTEQGRPVTQRRVEVYLGAVGARATESLIHLGSLQTDSGGRFVGELAIPDRVSIGRWSVILEFAGDEDLMPARAQ